MAADRARVSYDPSRQWRGLVAQQGRVTVEADWNEAAAIDAERDRQVTLGVVGPVGTPDDGYAVRPERTRGERGGWEPGRLAIGEGTLFLGGERLELREPVHYLAQPDWLDHSTDPMWRTPSARRGAEFRHELIYLLAFEQEVSAVEDSALADVALGGPDTMQRRRMLQHFVRCPSGSGTCEGSRGAFERSLAEHGLRFDPATMTARSAARLLVSFIQAPGAKSNELPAAGSYLGAENQMIRVMVTRVDDETGEPTIVWGFDDASFLHRIKDAMPGPEGTVLTLVNAPVDSFHYPAKGQAVELLRDAVKLTDKDYIASARGFVTEVSQPYQPADRTLTVAGSPAEPGSTVGYSPDYLSAERTPQLYLRLWRGTAHARPDKPVRLGDTGVTVTLSSDRDFHAGDYWHFAVRPLKPAIVYPERYAIEPQPPDGPRFWACPLGVVTWRERRDEDEDEGGYENDEDEDEDEDEGGYEDEDDEDEGGYENDEDEDEDEGGYEDEDEDEDEDDEGGYKPEYENEGGYKRADEDEDEGGYEDEDEDERENRRPRTESCLPHFSGLVKLTSASGGGCTVDVGPEQVAGGGSLQELIDGYARHGPITVCLRPGTYTLAAPLRLGPELDGIKLQAPDRGVILRGPERAGSEFVLGLIMVVDASSVTIRGIELAPPLARFSPGERAFSGLHSGNRRLFEEFRRDLHVAIGISARNATDLAVEECAFDIPEPHGAKLFAAGIMADGAIDGLRVADCSFHPGRPGFERRRRWPPRVLRNASLAFHDLAAGRREDIPHQLTFGYLQVPRFESRLRREDMPHRLDDAVLADCLFYGVTVPALVMAHIGSLRMSSNTIRDAYGGFWLLSLPDPELRVIFDRIAVGSAEAYLEASRGAGAAALMDRIFAFATAMARVLPEPAAGEHRLEPRRIIAAHPALLGAAREVFGEFYLPITDSGEVPDEIDILFIEEDNGGPETESHAAWERPADSGRDGWVPRLRLDVGDCQIDAVVASSPCGAGLIVADFSAETGSVLLHDNRIRARFPGGETVFIGRIAEACVTGNVIANETADERDELRSRSMRLFTATLPPAVAITGNVFIQPPRLPRREYIPEEGPAYSLEWDLLNTVIRYGEESEGRASRYGEPEGRASRREEPEGRASRYGEPGGRASRRRASRREEPEARASRRRASRREEPEARASRHEESEADESAEWDEEPERRESAIEDEEPERRESAIEDEEPERRESAIEDEEPERRERGGAFLHPHLPHRLQLVVADGPNAGRSFELRQGEMVIGREQGSDIHIDDPTVSHNHALLRVHEQEATIEDLRSTNGTQVNDVPIDSPTPLAPGDHIELGGVHLVVERHEFGHRDERR
jgi:hypothetical protein